MSIKNIIIVSATLVGAACSNQDEPIGGRLDAPVAAEFSAEIGEPISRAVNASWEAHDAIGISGGGYNNKKYITATGNGGFTHLGFMLDDGDGIYFQNTSDVTFTAYYPFSGSENTAPGNISASTTDQTASKTFDFLWAQATVNYKSKPVKFTFTHKMTRLILNLKTDANAGFSASDVTNGTYKLSGIKHSGSFDTTTGTATANGTATNDWTITGTPSSGNVRTYTMILFPQSGANLTLTATIGGNDYACDFSPELAAGTSYTYTITIQKTGLTVADSSITPWDNGDSYEGTATPPDSFNGHPAVLMREASGTIPALYFADRNIGADSPEDAGLYFWWGDIEGHAAGSNFSFSYSLPPANSTYNKDAAALMSAGFVTETSDGNLCLEKDAARQLWKGEWRMPNKAEWEWLIANCTWTWTTQNGVDGYKVKSNTNGEIFLPCVGYYSGTSLNGLGTNNWGYFWSASPLSNNKNQSYYLSIWSDAHNVAGNSRYFGMPIRGVVTQ